MRLSLPHCQAATHATSARSRWRRRTNEGRESIVFSHHNPQLDPLLDTSPSTPPYQMSSTMQDQPFQYPSPKTRNPDEPHRHSLSTSVPQDRVPLQSQPIPHRPELSRSESTPQFAHSRPIPIRTHTATHRPTAVRPSVDFASQPGSSRGQSRTMDDVEREELTTKGRKRKRLAKACSACHVSLGPSFILVTSPERTPLSPIGPPTPFNQAPSFAPQ